MKRIVANTERRYESKAAELINAISKLASSEDALENFESYVSVHGDSWFSKYVKDLDSLISELDSFADITE